MENPTENTDQNVVKLETDKDVDLTEVSRYEATKKRLEAERKAKNAKILKQLADGTYPKTPGSHR